MFSKQKGEYGYLKAYRSRKLIAALILAAMIAFILVTMLIYWGDTGRVAVVFAILLVLPFAKFIIAWIVCAKFNPLSKDTYDQLIKDIKDNGTKFTKNELLFDVVISHYEGMRFYPSVCIKNGKIIALVLDNKKDDNPKDNVTWLKRASENSKYEYIVTVCNSLEAYEKKILSISEPNDKNKTIDKHMTENVLTYCV